MSTESAIEFMEGRIETTGLRHRVVAKLGVLPLDYGGDLIIITDGSNDVIVASFVLRITIDAEEEPPKDPKPSGAPKDKPPTTPKGPKSPPRNPTPIKTPRRGGGGKGAKPGKR
jgi:hypothetical protein